LAIEDRWLAIAELLSLGGITRMSEATPKSKVRWLVALVERRSRRGWWAYVIWLLVYLFTAMMFAGEMTAHSGATAAQMLPLLIPVVIVIVQWVRPTILGWAVIFLPTFLYFGIGVYYAITNNLGPHPQWEHDLGGLILGSFFLAALLAACLAVMFAARPRRFHETHAA
jgi:hypothetical protein